jgi:hypothetical protein
MAVSSITVQSNLTATTTGGSTITSATTTKQFSTSDATPDLQTQLTQEVTVGASLTTVDPGLVDLTKSHIVKFRNTSTDTTRVVMVVGTMGGTDRILGFMRAGCPFGSEEHPGSGFSLPGTGGFPTASAGPTAYKLFTYAVNGGNSGASCVVEVSIVQTGSLVSVTPTNNGNVVA